MPEDILQRMPEARKNGKLRLLNDLRFADGSSYLDTMKMLLGMDEATSIGALSMANVNSSLKAELRRTRYWERN